MTGAVSENVGDNADAAGASGNGVDAAGAGGSAAKARADFEVALRERDAKIAELEGEIAEAAKSAKVRRMASSESGVVQLSRRLTANYGRGFTETNLKYMRQFYLAFPKGHALRDELTWTHYRALSRVGDFEARFWYEREAAEQGWSSRTLERNISAQYYHRLLQSQGEGRVAVEGEMRELTSPL